MPRVTRDGKVNQSITVEVTGKRIVDRVTKQRRSPPRVKSLLAAPVDVACQVFTSQFTTVLRRKNVERNCERVWRGASTSSRRTFPDR